MLIAVPQLLKSFLKISYQKLSEILNIQALTDLKIGQDLWQGNECLMNLCDISLSEESL